jgi:PAS domain S-box-containing protein
MREHSWVSRAKAFGRAREQSDSGARSRRVRIIGVKVAAIFAVPLLMVLVTGAISMQLLRQTAAAASGTQAPFALARELGRVSQVLGAGVIFSVLAIALAAWAMSTGVMISVRRVLLGMERISQGVLEYRADVSDGRELSELAAQFNSIVQAVENSQANLECSIRIRQIVLEALDDGVVVVDREGRLVFANRAAGEMLGPAPARVPVTRWAEWYGLYLADRKTLCDSDTMPLVLAMQGRGVSDLELYVSNPRAAAPRRVKTSVTPITDEDGRLWGGVAVLRDITGHSRAEEALRESEEKFRSFVETTYEWIWSTDAEGSLTYSNPAVETMLGYGATGLRGHSIAELVHPQDRAQFSQWLSEASEDGNRGVARVILRWLHKLGGQRWIESNAVPIIDSRGRVAGYRGTSRDITIRQMAEDEVLKLTHELRNRVSQLDAANRELETFSYSVSHDLRAPLRSIDGFSQALLEDYSDVIDAPGRDYLRRVRAASQRMAQLIDDLLTLSRVARGDLSRARVDLTALARMVAGNLQEALPDRKVQFVIEPDLFVDADPRLLQIVMENLLGNAWKFSRRSQEARIEVGSTEQRGERVCFVSDNGVGFDMQYAEKLFGAFQRLHAIEEFEGTGIGLATVQRIIHRHGGRVWARAAVNQGATFYFTLG